MNIPAKLKWLAGLGLIGAGIIIYSVLKPIEYKESIEQFKCNKVIDEVDFMDNTALIRQGSDEGKEIMVPFALDEPVFSSESLFWGGPEMKIFNRQGETERSLSEIISSLRNENINELIEGSLRNIYLTNKLGSRYLEISPDGKKILTIIDVERRKRDDDYHTVKYLLLADIDGKNPRILGKFPPTPTYRLSYRFSQDSRKITYSYYTFGRQERYDEEKVRTIDLSGRILFEFESCQEIQNEKRCIASTSGLSPDGKELILDFDDYYSPKSAELGMMNIPDGKVKIYGGKYFNKTHNFFFSPDGKKIIYQKSTDPNPGESGPLEIDDIYVMNRDGSGLKRLTNTSKFHEVILSVSPNGEEFVFWSRPFDDKGKSSMYKMRFDGSSKQEIRRFYQQV